MTQTLSPLTMSCLRRQADASSALKPAAPRSMRERQEEVVMYRCPKCGDLHDLEEEAEDCCAADDDDDDDHVRCPVCGEACADHHAAANCRLWREASHAEVPHA